MNDIERFEPLWGSWYVKELIGEGSYGKVYEIEREEFGTVYKAALKYIKIPKSSGEVKSIMAEGMDREAAERYFKEFAERIVKEVQLMAKVKGNSNIVSYEDHSVIKTQDKTEWNLFIRMELLTGLVDYITENKITRKDIIKLGIDICRALEVCQKHNIIHRDIKPENIFISEDGNFKLGDFGIARQIEKTMAGLSKKGTYTYMAPEVYLGKEYGSNVDIYSLGIVMYRFLNNNRTPFLPPYPEKISGNVREKALAKRMGGKELPKPVNADGRLAEIVLKACAYKPADRYDSPLEMRRALEAIFADEEHTGQIEEGSHEDTISNDSVQYTHSSDHSSSAGGSLDSKIKPIVFTEEKSETIDIDKWENIPDSGENSSGDDTADINKRENDQSDETVDIDKWEQSNEDETVDIDKWESDQNDETVDIDKWESDQNDETVDIDKWEQDQYDETVDIDKWEQDNEDETVDIDKWEQDQYDETVDIDKWEQDNLDETVDIGMWDKKRSAAGDEAKKAVSPPVSAKKPKEKKKGLTAAVLVCAAVVVIAIAALTALRGGDDGKITYTNGDVYEGETLNDKRNGSGTMTYADGSLYKGQWENDVKNGRGTMYFASGDVYEGDWENNSMSGTGTMTYAEGDVYEGSWVNNFKSGTGTMTYANGNIYEGSWMLNGYNGYGIMTYKNGDVYSGDWKDSEQSGTGTMTYADGTVKSGTWESGELVSEED